MASQNYKATALRTLPPYSRPAQVKRSTTPPQPTRAPRAAPRRSVAMVEDPGVPKLLLTRAEACYALGVSERRLDGLLVTRELPSLMIGSMRRIPLVELERYVERLRARQAGDCSDSAQLRAVEG